MEVSGIFAKLQVDIEEIQFYMVLTWFTVLGRVNSAAAGLISSVFAFCKLGNKQKQ